jgi:hypothetical protein
MARIGKAAAMILLGQSATAAAEPIQVVYTIGIVQ